MNPVDIGVRVFDDLVSGDVRRSVSAMLAGLVIPAGSNRVPIDIDELMKTGFVDAITSVEVSRVAPPKISLASLRKR